MNILVACIGNIFLGDDGFGVEVARQLAATPLANGVEVKDFGIRGLDLTYALMEPHDLVILVDACPCGRTPGTVYLIEPDGIDENSYNIDPHDMNPLSVLRTVQSMDGPSCPILIAGCEPADLGPAEGKMGLSKPVAAAVGEAVRLVESLIERASRGERIDVN